MKNAAAKKPSGELKKIPRRKFALIYNNLRMFDSKKITSYLPSFFFHNSTYQRIYTRYFNQRF